MASNEARQTGLQMLIKQTELQLTPHPRGFHLITDEIERALVELGQVSTGLLHVFIRPYIGFTDY